MDCTAEYTVSLLKRCGRHMADLQPRKFRDLEYICSGIAWVQQVHILALGSPELTVSFPILQSLIPDSPLGLSNRPPCDLHPG